MAVDNEFIGWAMVLITHILMSNPANTLPKESEATTWQTR